MTTDSPAPRPDLEAFRALKRRLDHVSISDGREVLEALIALFDSGPSVLAYIDRFEAALQLRYEKLDPAPLRAIYDEVCRAEKS